MELAINPEETEVLQGLLEKCLGELREEIYHAETFDFKDDLKNEEKILRSLLAKLGATAH